MAANFSSPDISSLQLEAHIYVAHFLHMHLKISFSLSPPSANGEQTWANIHDDKEEWLSEV